MVTLLSGTLLFMSVVAYTHALPLCPCPEEQWQPPFKPSQMVYSEFPEDRRRSLSLIDRRDLRSQKKNSQPTPPTTRAVRYSDLLKSDYEGNPPPPETGRVQNEKYLRYSGSAADYVDQKTNLYDDRDYGQRTRGSQNYLDYDDGTSESREEGTSVHGERPSDYSSENSPEYQYSNGYNDYYRDKKSKEDNDNVEPNFTLEDFELDPEVMNPLPPLSAPPSDGSEGTGNRGEKERDDEVHELSDTERQSEERQKIHAFRDQRYHSYKPPQHHKNQAAGFPMANTVGPVFRYPNLSLMTPSQPGWGRWKNVLAQTEVSGLQIMKPPPLGQAQTWDKIANEISATDSRSHEMVQYSKRAQQTRQALMRHNMPFLHVPQYHYSKMKATGAS